MDNLEKIRQQGGVEVMKASAGSGKTYALSREYIRLLLENRNEDHPYRHILAVTFTNKATDEMKSRIIDELDTLARFPDHSPYKDYLLEHCSISSLDELSAECSRLLSDILTDYGAFSVSTIDRFFQRVLRSFSREVGQFAEYQIELDRAALVEEAVERVLDSLSETDRDLLDWLSQSSIDNISNGDGYKLKDNLSSFAKGYMSESYRKKVEDLGIDSQEAFSKDNLLKLKKICRKISAQYEQQFKALATDAHAVASSAVKPAGNLVKKLATFSEKGPGGLDTGFLKKRPQYWGKAMEDNDFVARLEAMLGEPLRIYNTAKLLRSQVEVFHVAEQLDKEFAAMLREKNVLSLDDTNSILNDIISGSDTPFIYEKVGVRFQHFLLDEFQDTSTTQWENFRPLLLGSISEGCYNLVVGDVKQSIYRWRSADWDILDSRVPAELPRTELHPLTANWRSAESIVAFNNGFYKEWASKLDWQLREKMRECGLPVDGSQRSIADIYSDVQQQAQDKIKVKGSVELTMCEGSELYDKTLEAVHQAMERGFARKDIAVIVRSNAMGQEIATRLTAEGQSVITNDSLRISSSRVIRRLVSQMYKLDNPDDPINSYFATEFEPEKMQECQSIIDIAEQMLEAMDAGEVNADTLYVLAFMDLVRDYVSRNSNSLHAFLKYWEEDGVKRSISSPEGMDAITIITIHSAKGLDYPYVVLPFKLKESWINSYAHFWEAPEVDGTEFNSVSKALYNTKLGESSLNSLFAKNYLRELRLSYIDEINVWYVATTRASQAMHIISPMPSKDVMAHVKGEPWANFNGISGALYQYCVDCDAQQTPSGFIFGEIAQKWEKQSSSWVKPSAPSSEVELNYYDPNCTTRSTHQLRTRSDSRDFMDSKRRWGTVLHKILESVIGIEDLGDAVKQAQQSGMLSSEKAEEAKALLERAIADVEDRGWFPGDTRRIVDERDIVCGTEVKRPDRVVITDDGVEIIDYKFGEPHRKYLYQVRHYADLYRQMGYKKVSAYIWYVETSTIVKA